MFTREVFTTDAPQELTLRTPPNWTAVIFFAILSGLHFCISIPAFYHGRWEGYLSFIFASVFLLVSIICVLARIEMSIQPESKNIRLCSRVGPVRFVRFVPFADVHAIRLTTAANESRIEVLCDNEDIECPPTSIPRQQAYLAIMMNVELIKVSDEELAAVNDRLL